MRSEHFTYCPCGIENPYEVCCGALIEGNAIAQTPEQLMRSRYSAYTKADMKYIERTMSGQAAKGFDAKKGERWARSVTWRGLRIVKASPVEQGNRGTVEFIAYYEEHGRLQQMHEISVFRKKDGGWQYIDSLPNETNPALSPAANTAPKVGRNDACPCGSGKKYKKCCLKK